MWGQEGWFAYALKTNNHAHHFEKGLYILFTVTPILTGNKLAALQGLWKSK